MSRDAEPDVPGRQLPILLALALAGFVTALDNNIVNTALPTIQRQLQASVADLEWVASSYVLTFAALLIVGGRLADLLGRRRVLVSGLLALIATSVAAGFAPGPVLLIAARLAQGASAALVMPASLAVLAADVRAERQQLAAGVWTGALAAALALGPVLGGVLTEQLGWSWIFYLHLPAGLVTVVLVRRGLPDAAPRRRGRWWDQLDPAGLGLSTAVLAALSFALVQGQSVGFAAPSVLIAFVVAVVAMPVLVWVERRVRAPMLEFALFRDRVFAGGTVAQVLWGLSINGAFLFTSLFLQDVLGLSPASAGLVFLPLAAVLVLFVPVVPHVSAAVSTRWAVTLGLVLVAVGLVWVSFASVDARVVDLLPGLIAIGLGSALTTPLTSAVLTTVPPRTAGLASAIVSAGREASGVVGIALIGVVVSWGRRSAAAVSSDVAFLHGYAWGLRVAAALVLLGAAVTALSLPGRRATDSGPAWADSARSERTPESAGSR